MALYRQHGEYDLTKCVLESNNKDLINLTDLFIDISLYESLLTNTMSGAISIIDTYNLVNTLPIVGNETITIEFNTKSAESNKILYTGVIYKISEQSKISETAKGYILHFVSKEQITNIRSIHNTAYKAAISTIVEKVYDTIKNVKKLITRETKGIEHYIAHTKTPIECITSLVKKSISTKNEHGYLFYEDNKTFCFYPLEYLYSQEPVTKYSYMINNVVRSDHEKLSDKFSEIQDIQYLSNNDFLSNVKNGVYEGTYKEFNLKSSSIKTETFNYSDNFDSAKHLGKYPYIIDQEVDNHSDIYYYSNDAITNRLYSRSVINQLNNFRCLITVFGDSSLKVGDVIDCTLPSYEGIDGNNSDTMYSGRFLICNIKHIITKSAYMQNIEICKDSFNKKF